MNTLSTRTLKSLALVLLAASLLPCGTTGCKKKETPVEQVVPTPVPPPPSGSVVYTIGGHLARIDLQSGTAVPLTTGKSTEWFPVCSPQGDQIVFWSNSEKNFDLWKVNMDGTQRVQLTEFDSEALPPSGQNLYLNNAAAWSPDGKKIAYSNNGDLWEMDSEGYNPRTLLTGRDAYSPAYSPKDSSLVFVSAGEDSVYNLYKLNLTDNTVTKLTSYTDWNTGSPSFSSDGSKILFVLFRENVSQIYTVAADGTGPANLTTDNTSLCPRWAQQDKKIVFCSTAEDLSAEVCMINANGTGRTKLTPMGGTSPSWAAYIPMASVPTPVGQ